MLSRAVRAVALAALAAGVATPTLDIDPGLRRVLSRELKFSPGDFADIARGKVVRRTLETRAANEIAVVGVIWINASMEASLDAFRDIARFKKGEGILQIGRFSDPPTLEDMAGLTVDDDDLDGEACRVGNCSVRLPARELVRFRREIDWSAPGAKAQAGALFKQMVFDQVRAYWSGEGERIAQYDDDKRPIRPGPEFAGILANSPYLSELAPGLPEHLRDFPATRTPGYEDFLYWSKESLGIGAPFITVTHVTIAHPVPGIGVITSKDVYSSRYIDSSLGITVASGPADGGGFALVYLNRTRANALRGGFRALRRAMVERLARSGIEESLKKVKARFELAH
jgi:hypothetical protein